MAGLVFCNYSAFFDEMYMLESNRNDQGELAGKASITSSLHDPRIPEVLRSLSHYLSSHMASLVFCKYSAFFNKMYMLESNKTTEVNWQAKQASQVACVSAYLKC